MAGSLPDPETSPCRIDHPGGIVLLRRPFPQENSNKILRYDVKCSQRVELDKIHRSHEAFDSIDAESGVNIGSVIPPEAFQPFANQV